MFFFGKRATDLSIDKNANFIFEIELVLTYLQMSFVVNQIPLSQLVIQTSIFSLFVRIPKVNTVHLNMK